MQTYGKVNGRAWRVGGWAVAIWLVCGAGYAWGQSMTFDQAMGAMKERNEALMAAQDDIDQRDAEREAAKGLRYPKAEFEFKNTTLADPVAISTYPVKLFNYQLQEENFSDARLTVSLPLYAGGRIDAANGAAEARQSEARAMGRMTEDQMVTELAQRYFGLTMARKARDVQALKVEVMGKHVYRSERLMEEGIIARVEYLNAKVALANAETELSAAEHDVAIVQEGLSNILVNATAVDPATPLFVVRDMEPCDAFQGSVNDEHPIVQMLDAKHNLAEQGVKAEKGADKPTVYLFAMREFIPTDLSVMDPLWAAGLGMEMTLFDGFQGEHKVDAAEAVVSKVTHLQQKARRDLKTLVLKRYEEMTKALDQYDSFNETLVLTQENLRVRIRAFEEGMATSVEVVDAALAHNRAQLGRFKSAFDFDLALFQLMEASGRTAKYREYLARAVPVDMANPGLQGTVDAVSEKDPNLPPAQESK